MALKVKTDKLAAVHRAIDTLRNSRVMVGIPAEDADRKGGEITNAQLGYIHEFGAPEVNIPARPFLAPGVKGAREEITAQLKKAGQAVLAGNAEAVDRALNAAGIVAQNAARQKIQAGPFVPLKPATIYQRQHRKVAPRSGEQPLIDTGQLRTSITYVVRRVKGT
jgi:phage gpG-like protein